MSRLAQGFARYRNVERAFAFFILHIWHACGTRAWDLRFSGGAIQLVSLVH